MKTIKICKNTQSSIEFIILIAFLLLFFVVFFEVIQGNLSDKMREKRDAEINDIAVTVQDEINMAFKSGDGYLREFRIPEKLMGESYEIKIISDRVYIRTLDNRNSILLPISAVSGQPVAGQNIIKKENGLVYINN